MGRCGGERGPWGLVGPVTDTQAGMLQWGFELPESLGSSRETATVGWQEEKMGC